LAVLQESIYEIIKNTKYCV